MITFFCSPRSFDDHHISLIQRNAIHSWLTLDPAPEVLLFGNERGVERVAEELGVRQIPSVGTNARGIPLRSSMCEIARVEATYEFLCIINADIVIVDDLYAVVRRLPFDHFLATGRRHDLDVRKPIPFHEPSWRSSMRDTAARSGELRGPSTIDYAVYPSSIFPPILPPFPVNSFGWDPWFLFEHKRRRIPVIDVTPSVLAVHQNHESRDANRQKWRAWLRDSDSMRLLQESGGFSNMMTLREADFRLRPDGLVRPSAVGRVLSALATRRFYRTALGAYRSVKTRLRR